MEIQRSFAKRMVVLEAQCGQLKEEKFKLKEQVMELKGREEEMIEKYLKVKNKYAKVQEEFGSEKMKWGEEEEILRENCRREWVVKRKLEVDLKAAKRKITNGGVEMTQKLMAMEKHFQSLLEERNGRINTLLAKNEALDRHNNRLVIDFEAQVATEAKKQEMVTEENISELLQKIEVLEREKGEFEAGSKRKGELIVKLEEEVRAIEGMEKILREKYEERGKQISSLSGEIKALGRQDSELESDLEPAITRAPELDKALLDLKSFLEEEKGKIKEECDCRIATLLAKNEALNKHNNMLEMSFEARMAMEAKKQEAVNEGKILVLLQKIEVLRREKGEFKANNKKKDELIIKLEEEAKAITGMEKMLREKFEAQVSSLSGEIEALARRNSKLESELELARMKATELEKALLEIKSSWEEEKRKIRVDSNCRTATLLVENEALAKRNSMLEMEFEARMTVEAKKQEALIEEKLLELLQKTVFEREKGELEAEFHKMKDDKSHETEGNSDVNKAFESAKNIVENEMKKISELVKSVGVLEREKEAEKRAMEDEGKKKVSELTLRIEDLEKQKMENEAKFCSENRDRSEEAKRILNEKMTLEAEMRILEAETEKKALELVQRNERIEVLVRERRGLETEVCREKRERSEEIKKVLSEKNILERDKQKLEVETREKDERIKVLEQEKERLAGEKKEIEANWGAVKFQDDAELLQRVHLARNFGISSTLTAENAGPKSVDVSFMEPDVSLVGGSQSRELLDSELQKRKVEGLGYSVANQAGTKRHKLDGLVEHKLTFKNRQDMFNAFTNNNELCMRSVCALYRKYKSLGDWKDRSASTSCKGFMQPYEIRGMVLGELLTSGDLEGTVKMSLAEFEQADPSGLQDCRQIAWNHYKELFKIYKNKLDPLLKLGDEMN